MLCSINDYVATSGAGITFITELMMASGSYGIFDSSQD